MGGNALKGLVETRRYNKDEYFALCEEVVGLLEVAIGSEEVRIEVIPAYKEKETFGDMDVLIEVTPALLKGLKLKLLQCFGKDTYMNKDGKPFNQFLAKEDLQPDTCYSLGYKEFQIDLILTRPALFQPSLDYFSYNDLGNLVGRIAHKFGFKWGHEGLLYPVMDGDYKIAEIVVSRDWYMCLASFGFDPDKFERGFDNLEEVFEFVAESTFFNPDIYLLDNRNATGRIRDKKRKTYTYFLVWCATHSEKLCRHDYSAPKSERLPMAFKMFSWTTFKAEYDAVQEEYAKEKAYRAKFNGDVVKEITGLAGRELGVFMSNVRKLERFRISLECLSEDEFKTWIKMLHLENMRLA